MKLEGIYVPLITPFSDDLSIDFDACGRMIDWQIDNGVHGIIVGGSTGEFFALSSDERTRQFEFFVERVAKRRPVIAGINDLLPARCYELAAAARAAGVDALLVAAPPYALPGPADLAAHCREIDRVADLPIILYNYPARTGTRMDDDFLALTMDIDNVIAIKESSGEIDRIQQLVQHYPALQLSAGAEDLVLEFFAWGARSWVSVIANFMPREAVRLYETCVRDGNFDTGRQAMLALLPLMRCLERGSTFLQSVKAACEIMGRPGGAARPPFEPLPAHQRSELEHIVRTSQQATARLLGT